VADLQRVLSYDDPLHDQLQDPLLLVLRELIQARPNPFAEGRQFPPGGLGLSQARVKLLLLGGVGDKDLATVLDLLAPLLQLVQPDHFSLIGIDQPDLLAIHATKLYFHLPIPGGRGHLLAGRPDEGFELVRQGRRVVEQASNMPPDRGIQVLRLHIGPRAARLMRWADRLAAGALVVAPAAAAFAGVGDTDHGATAAPASQEAAQQIEMAIVASRAQICIP
jgi:hypothetical protein